MRDMIALVLESEGYEVHGAENGSAALQLVKAGGRYDAVISDMYLPDTDGLTLFTQIRDCCPEVRYLILSSENDSAIIRRATGLGITYIVKDENFAEGIVRALRN